ncbi:transposase [Pinirhizobacter soli]|uniref:transposase n=1 Tax=Pinirhizobacter soli TaxID=2786953 RepID=UPI0025462C5F|nr:transposase [Pinirhizobacter soli]
MVMTDESNAFSGLAAYHDHYVVCHAREMCTSEGVNNNMSETFNSRMRRAEYGVHHGYRPKYLQDRASESAWRENWRRASQRERVEEILKIWLTSPHSKWWRGYWQGNHRDGELTLDYFVKRQKRAL